MPSSADPFRKSLLSISAAHRVLFALAALIILWGAILWAVALP